MKRSQMVEYMTNEYHASQRGGMSEMSDKERMDYLLSKIEEIMFPPELSSNRMSYDWLQRPHGWEKE